jgi:hypothetical protein
MENFTDIQNKIDFTESDSDSLRFFFASSGRDDVAALNEYLWSTLAPVRYESYDIENQSDVRDGGVGQPRQKSEDIETYIARAKGFSTAWPKSFTCAVSGPSSLHRNCAISEILSSNTEADCLSGSRSSARRRRRYRQAVAPLAGSNSEDSEHSKTQAFSSSFKDQCSTLTRQLEGDHESQLLAATTLRGNVWTFSQDQNGCRVVQLALGLQRSIAESVTAELHGHVIEALGSPHANFVVQRLVEVMPTARSSFVAMELAGYAGDAARHCYGCRILIRLAEHAATENSTIVLIDELLNEVAELARHIYGHHVIQAVLEHGSPAHKRFIASAFTETSLHGETALRFALHRNASRVLESVMLHCSPEDQSALCYSLLKEDDSIMQLARSSFGCYVLMAVIRQSGECSQIGNARNLIQSISHELGQNKHGKRLLECLDQSNDDRAI